MNQHLQTRQSSKSFGLIYNGLLSPLAIAVYDKHPPRCTWCELECYCDPEPSVAHIFVISMLKGDYGPRDGVYHVQYLRVVHMTKNIDLFQHITADTEYTMTFSVHSGSEEWINEMGLLERALDRHKEILFTDFVGKASHSSCIGALSDILLHVKTQTQQKIEVTSEKKPNPHVAQRKKKV